MIILVVQAGNTKPYLGMIKAVQGRSMRDPNVSSLMTKQKELSSPRKEGAVQREKTEQYLL